MGVRNSLSRAWEREQQVIEQRPGLYKLLMVIAGMQLVSALFNVDSNRWFALLAVVFGVLFLAMTSLLYRAAKAAKATAR